MRKADCISITTCGNLPRLQIPPPTHHWSSILEPWNVSVSVVRVCCFGHYSIVVKQITFHRKRQTFLQRDGKGWGWLFPILVSLLRLWNSMCFAVFRRLEFQVTFENIVHWRFQNTQICSHFPRRTLKFSLDSFFYNLYRSFNSSWTCSAGSLLVIQRGSIKASSDGPVDKISIHFLDFQI